MSESPNAMPLSAATETEDEINLLDLLLVIARHKKRIITFTFVTALIAAGISLLLPNIYTGTAKILPAATKPVFASALMSQLGGLAGLAGGSLGLKNPGDLYISMLKSRNIMEKIARRFDLQAVYEEKTITETLKELERKSAIAAGKDGIIVVEVDDKDPQRAADMANTYIEELDN